MSDTYLHSAKTAHTDASINNPGGYVNSGTYAYDMATSGIAGMASSTGAPIIDATGLDWDYDGYEVKGLPSDDYSAMVGLHVHLRNTTIDPDWQIGYYIVSTTSTSISINALPSNWDTLATDIVELKVGGLLAYVSDAEDNGIVDGGDILGYMGDFELTEDWTQTPGSVGLDVTYQSVDATTGAVIVPERTLDGTGPLDTTDMATIDCGNSYQVIPGEYNNLIALNICGTINNYVVSNNVGDLVYLYNCVVSNNAVTGTDSTNTAGVLLLDDRDIITDCDFLAPSITNSTIELLEFDGAVCITGCRIECYSAVYCITGQQVSAIGNVIFSDGTCLGVQEESNATSSTTTIVARNTFYNLVNCVTVKGLMPISLYDNLVVDCDYFVLNKYTALQRIISTNNCIGSSCAAYTGGDYDFIIIGDNDNVTDETAATIFNAHTTGDFRPKAETAPDEAAMMGNDCGALEAIAATGGGSANVVGIGYTQNF